MPCYASSFPKYIKGNVKAFPNPAFQQKLQAKPGTEGDTQKVIINVGGMKANKNFITLLQSFALIAKDHPKWVIKVYGKTDEGNQPHKVEIREFIKAHHLEDRVLICGPTDDIFAEFAASHIHVISSLSEGCPTCVLEAMATGVPSIGFADCPGTNELIRDGEDGLLVSPDDRVGNLSNALRQLMNSSKQRGEMGKRARANSKKFSPDLIYDQWEQLFYEAAEYKNDPERLFREQMAIDPERAMHARRMREKLVQQYKG
jgi:glycosyltransferase involved in cell wall biosynthesis